MITIFIQKAEGNLSDAAHTLLRKILLEHYQLTDPVVYRAESGKPYLREGPYIGLSHSRGWIAVGIADVPFGVDLEAAGRKVHQGLAERVCSERELAWYRQQGSTPEAFLTLWTLKESYYKYLGIGLPGFPNQTEFCFDRNWKLLDSACHFVTHQTKELRIAVCSNTEQSVSYSEI